MAQPLRACPTGQVLPLIRTARRKLFCGKKAQPENGPGCCKKYKLG